MKIIVGIVFTLVLAVADMGCERKKLETVIPTPDEISALPQKHTSDPQPPGPELGTDESLAASENEAGRSEDEPEDEDSEELGDDVLD